MGRKGRGVGKGGYPYNKNNSKGFKRGKERSEERERASKG